MTQSIVFNGTFKDKILIDRKIMKHSSAIDYVCLDRKTTRRKEMSDLLHDNRIMQGAYIVVADKDNECFEDRIEIENERIAKSFIAATRFPRDAELGQTRGALMHAMVFQLDFTGGKYGQRTPANKSQRTPGGKEKYRARIAAATADAMRLPKWRYMWNCGGVYRRGEYQPLPLDISRTGNNINIAKRVR